MYLLKVHILVHTLFECVLDMCLKRSTSCFVKNFLKKYIYIKNYYYNFSFVRQNVEYFQIVIAMCIAICKVRVVALNIKKEKFFFKGRIRP